MELWNHPHLQPLILQDVTPTGKIIGVGSYGNVEEVAIPGALCAGKRVHSFLTTEDPKWLTKETAYGNVQKFICECKMLSRLRHPHIVQFIGIWLDQSNPYLVMEKMMTNLHDMLESKYKSTSQTSIPLAIKCSILQDIARGLAYLHKQKPPVIHRDLSAKNVLLNSAMVAKIADLGMARILPAKDSATMTKAPGANVYMPPEALEFKCTYNTSIDMFSLGVITIFVLSQMFPCDIKPPTYIDEIKGSLIARTELERREHYTLTIYHDFPKTHPLIKLIESCLDNKPKARPSIDQALKLLDQALTDVKGSRYVNNSKLQLLQLLEVKDEDIQKHKMVLDL